MQPGSLQCLPCSAGRYAFSWGSTHCKHCIAGTHAPAPAATLCTMCPAGRTSLEDGQAACAAPVAPATDLSQRFAVVVHFSIVLRGTEPDDVILRVSWMT